MIYLDVDMCILGPSFFNHKYIDLHEAQNPPLLKSQNIPIAGWQFRRGSEPASARHLNLLVTLALEPARLVRACQNRYHSTGNCRTGRAPFLDKKQLHCLLTYFPPTKIPALGLQKRVWVAISFFLRSN